MTTQLSPADYAPRLSLADIPGDVPDLMAAPPQRWGIIGAGKIASSFAGGLRERTSQRVTAVGSRDLAKAQAFADAHTHEATAYGSYEGLLHDPSVDVVYVATPHSHHLDHALAALEAGKHVLCEKPLTRSAKESQQLIDAARQAGVFLMEAVWTRFLPHIAAMRSEIARGTIGQVTMIEADFDIYRDYDPHHRLFAPQLAGGAILDLGIYPLHLAHSLLGMPQDMAVTGTLAPTGVDDHVAMMLSWEGGQHALLHTSTRSAGAVAARITGTQGRIDIPSQFHTPTDLIITSHTGDRLSFESPRGEGKVYEAAEVARLISAGAQESPRHSWQDTMELAQLMDQARSLVGVVYPGE